MSAIAKVSRLVLCLALTSIAGQAARATERYCLDGICRSSCLQEVCLHVSTSESYGLVEAENRFDVPVGIEIEFKQLQNAEPYPPAPVRAVVKPGKAQQVVKLTFENPYAPASFPFQWSFSYGDPTALHDSRAEYSMPFGGVEKRVLTQGQNGRFTHKGTSRYSFDFGMPIGTPILAARAGRVVEVSDGYTKSGVSPEFLDKANAVTVLHADGTFATYAHLDPGAGVRRNMMVNVGDVLGFSGDTGFSTGPHLHFSVWKATSRGGATLPIRFRSGDARFFVPTEGVAYAPTCHKDGVACRPGELPARPASWGAPPAAKASDGTCQCSNGSVITTDLPCRMVCP